MQQVRRKIATVPWQEWYRGRVAQHLCAKETHIAAIQLVLNSLHTRGRIDQAPLDVIIDLTKKSSVVKAPEDLPTGTLALPPCVPLTSRVYDKSTHPHRVPIAVTEKSAVADGRPDTRKTGKATYEPRRTVYYVHPEYKLPEESKDKLDDAVASDVCAWEWKGNESLHPFWAVERFTEEERRKAQKGAFSLKCENKEFAAVTVGTSGGDSIAITLAVGVPIMTNSVDVKKGEELFLENTTRKDADKRMEGSWETDVAKTEKAEKAPKARAKAKTAASSLDVVTEI